MRHGMTDEQLIEEIQNNLLGPEDTFLFGCKQCGCCCRNREELITVTGYDIYNIAKAMGISAAEAAMKYCTISPGETSALPIAHLNQRLDGSCSLLRKGLCMVQKNKPIACRLYPVGRYYDGKEQRYFRQGAGTCTGFGKEIKLKDWLEEFDIPALDKASEIWNKFIIAASFYARNLKEKRKVEEYVDFFNIGNTYEGKYVELTADIDLTGEVATPTYNGDIQKGNAFVISDTVVGKENAVITYSETENGIYTTELPTYKKAGSYSIWVKVSVDGYAEYKAEHEYMVIGAKDITLSLEVAAGAAYNKVNVKPVITGVYDTEFEGTLTVTGVEGTYTKDDFIYMGNHIAVAKETRPMNVNAGDNEITITYTKATVDNYADSTETTTVNADKAFATQAIVDDLNAAADAAVTDIYYNGTEHTVMDKIVVPDGWSVAVTRISDGTTNPGVTEVADKEFVEIRFTHANYNDVVVSRVLKVEPLNLTITVPDFDKGAGEPDNFTTKSVTYTSANFVASAEFATIDDLVATGNLNVVIVRKTFGEDDGNYELTVTYTPNDNYSIVIDDGDLTIGMPSDTKIEVVNNNVNGNGNSSADYVAGYRLVLVYTNTATARYTYDDKEMFDLSNAGYEYFDNTKAITEQTVDNYKYVYGIIVKAETGKDDAYYAEKVDFIGTNKYAPEKIVYDADINYDDKFSNNDTSSANSVLNVENELDAFFMYYFLKADYDRTAEGEYKSDKMVKLFDVQEVQKFINTKTTIQ